MLDATSGLPRNLLQTIIKCNEIMSLKHLHKIEKIHKVNFVTSSNNIIYLPVNAINLSILITMTLAHLFSYIEIK